MNASTVASSVTAGSIKLGGISSQLLLGNGTTIPTTTYVPTIAGLIQTGGRKFNKIDNTFIVANSSGSLIGTIVPSTGAQFAANELVAGDVYELKIDGGVNYTTGSNSTFTFTFAGVSFSMPVPYSQANANLRPLFNLRATFTVRTTSQQRVHINCLLITSLLLVLLLQRPV